MAIIYYILHVFLARFLWETYLVILPQDHNDYPPCSQQPFHVIVCDQALWDHMDYFVTGQLLNETNSSHLRQLPVCDD